MSLYAMARSIAEGGGGHMIMHTVLKAVLLLIRNTLVCSGTSCPPGLCMYIACISPSSMLSKGSLSGAKSWSSTLVVAKL